MRAHRHQPHRRQVLIAGTGLLLSTAIVRWADAARDVRITMSGTGSGSEVWFRPRGLLIEPGTTVHWINEDAGNVHTTTAYHPDNGKPLRIPANAAAWDSGYLLPGKSFTYVFDVAGVYDYFCTPHETAGMAARIVVSRPGTDLSAYTDTDPQLPQAVLETLPAVSDILNASVID